MSQETDKPLPQAAQPATGAITGNSAKSTSSNLCALKWIWAGAVVVALALAAGWLFFEQAGRLRQGAAQPTLTVVLLNRATFAAASTASARVTATPQPTPTATDTPLPTPTLTPTRPLPTPTATLRPTPAALAINATARVTLPEGRTLNLRDSASITSKIVSKLKNATLVTIVEGPVQAGSLRWWKIDDGQGLVGWSVEGYETDQYLVPVGWAK